MIFEGDPNIELRVDYGIYFFDGSAATGKSYLADELASRVPEDNRIFVATYMNDKYVDFGNKCTANILMFDRFDKYINSNIATFISNKVDSIILVDLKNVNLMIKYLQYGKNLGIVDINFSKDRIVVGDL